MITQPSGDYADRSGFRKADPDIPLAELAVIWCSDNVGVIGTSLPTSGGS